MGQVDAGQGLLEEAKAKLQGARTREAVEAVRVEFLGKKGRVSKSLEQVGKLPPEERKQVGQQVNALKVALEEALREALVRAEDAQLEAELQSGRVDVTLPGRGRRPGRRHPVSRTLEDIVRTMGRMGFEPYSGPEVELDLYNFESLNVPKDHPARDMQDTFYVDASWLKGGADSPVLLRTHTSPVQIHAMLSRKPPLRMVCGGRVYRKDSDLTHTPMFHQVEALRVDRRVTFAELRGTLDAFVRAFFGAETKTRFRASFFPFTEPSAEVDITCVMCAGKGCRVCKQSGWLEVLGAGMVHPNVLRAGGCDPNEYTGFAFGLGVERIAMLRYQIDDLRMMFENDARFLEQF